MNMISASAAASATAPLPFDHDAETAACVFTAAGLLLPHLERGQRVDAATLRGAMEAVAVCVRLAAAEKLEPFAAAVLIVTAGVPTGANAFTCKNS